MADATQRTVVVTGGAGFIGSHMCDTLIARGDRVLAIDNMMLGRRENLASVIDHPDFTFVEGDVMDATAFEPLFDGAQVDAVVHLAANSDIARSHATPDTDVRNTFLTTYAVLEAMRRHGVGEIVFASSSAIYGEAEGKIAEDHGPLMPISHYGAGKLASEAFISSYGENYGITSWMARFPNVVGDRSTHGAVYDFARKLKATPDRLEVLGNGTQEKPYLHVSDLIAAILTMWERTSEPRNVFNIGGTTRCTVRRMAEIVVEEWGRPARIDYTGGDRGWIGDVPKVDFDTSRIRALGWAPSLDSEGAVRAAARWMFENEV
jgi:UDP-glucose 4-epimerase